MTGQCSSAPFPRLRIAAQADATASVCCCNIVRCASALMLPLVASSRQQSARRAVVCLFTNSSRLCVARDVESYSRWFWSCPSFMLSRCPALRTRARPVHSVPSKQASLRPRSVPPGASVAVKRSFGLMSSFWAPKAASSGRSAGAQATATRAAQEAGQVTELWENQRFYYAFWCAELRVRLM